MLYIKIKRYISQTPIWQSLLISFVFVLGSAISIYLLVKETDELLVLHYSIPFGIDLVGFWYELYYIPLWGFVILIINALFSFFLLQAHRTLSQIIVVVTAILEIILGVSLYLILAQNTF